MTEIDPKVLAFIIGTLVTNLGAVVGFFVSIKVQQARLEVLVSKLEKDVDNLGDLYRSTKQ